ncbi:uncharacterized membrane protein (UPF0136 family) [Sphingomonas vulcanisoli]|uniref:Uncharacterized membrane protein (UPF0136 family) n=1 Tax=Sphingomonas vulcanisoli TaxID=1658060 RepID=A0ABX0TW67_9SPHN|nr:hypothetical protein [Sphingomonas vulcanisoli]NIJ08035.1 uncharacterized membrane protein (UPF0136 family) [Sphingomonas vulcanisoli]
MSKRNPIAAGGPLALIIMAGALIGAILHQPSLGVLIGVGLGATIAIALWLIDRERTGE